MGEHEQAVAIYQEMLARAREAGATADVAQALLGLSDIARGHGDAAAMIVYCEECLALSREIDDVELEVMAPGYAWHNLGLAAWLQHDLGRAGTLLASSLALFRERQHPPAVAEVLASVGRVERARGHLEQARCAFVESITLARESGPYFVVADDLEELAGLALLEHRAEPAARLLGAAQAQRSAKCIRPTSLREARHERARAEVRAALGDAAFEVAYQAGQALRREEAIALALDASQLSAG
jgi:tetratricopeptide (TPR) repeat protein